MSKKILFFDIPAPGNYNAYHSLISLLEERGFEVIYYNLESFSQKAQKDNITLISYQNFEGYNIESLSNKVSFFEFGDILIKTAENVLDFVRGEVLRLKPELILHDRYALWGKVIAAQHNVQAASIFPSFVLSPQLLNTETQKATNRRPNLTNILKGRNLINAYTRFCKKYDLTTESYNDLFINKERLNIVLSHEEFQPNREILDDGFRFVGPIFENTLKPKTFELIYISFGTIFNEALLDFCKKHLKELAPLGLPILVSLGNKGSLKDFEEFKELATVVDYVDQASTLSRSCVFINHAGANSVNESLHSETPMLLFPQTEEQKFIAKKIHERGLGINSSESPILSEGIAGLVSNLIEDPKYTRNIQAFNDHDLKLGANAAARLLEEYFYSEVKY